jgi:hypothetical protein
MNLVTPKAGAKHELLFNELAYVEVNSGGFVENLSVT